MRALIRFLAVVVLALVVSQPAIAQQRLDPQLADRDRYQVFFSDLKKAIAADDKAKVAAMVSYPFRTRIAGKRVTLRNAAAFRKNYNAIVTPRVKQSVAKQDFEALFSNAEGLMVGDGEVWFSTVGSSARPPVRIIAINS